MADPVRRFQPAKLRWEVLILPFGSSTTTISLGRAPPCIETLRSRHTFRKRFRTACKVLGRDRLASLTIQHGRHTFISHALAGGKTLAEVRDVAGHANVSITSTYLHVAVDDGDTPGNLFRFA